MEIIWKEVDLDDVLRYWAQGFQVDRGQKIVRFEFRVDVYSRIVTYKIFVQKDPQ